MTKAQQTILDRIGKDFAYRPYLDGDDDGQHADREQARNILKNAAIDLALFCPQSRELNHALNRIEEAVMWCHAAIDRHGVSSPNEKS